MVCPKRTRGYHRSVVAFGAIGRGQGKVKSKKEHKAERLNSGFQWSGIRWQVLVGFSNSQ